MNFQPHGLLFDESLQNCILQPASQFMHDWMHLLCVGGIGQTTIYLFLEAVSNTTGENIYKMIAGYMELWVLPKSRTISLESLFAPKRQKSNKEANTFKRNASEVLAILPILSLFAQNVFMRANQCCKECQALVFVAELLELLQAIPHGFASPELIRGKVSQIQDKYEECGWGSYMHPKFHWLLHLGSHLSRWGLLISCWAHERKHRIVKRYSQDIQNTRSFEKSVLHQVVSHDLALLLDPEYFGQDARLKKQCRATNKVKDFFASAWSEPVKTCYMCTSAHLSPAGVASKKDIVMLKTSKQVCEVWLFAEVNGENVALLSFWTLLEDNGASTLWQTQDNPQLVSTSDIQCALCYRLYKDGKAIVLLPLECR